MIRIAFYVYRSMWGMLLRYAFDSDRQGKEWHAANSLLNQPSFRLPEGSGKDPFIGFRVLYRLWSKVFSGTGAYSSMDGNRSEAILDMGLACKLRGEYIRRLTGSEPSTFINKNELPGLGGKYGHLVILKFAFLNSLCLIPFSMLLPGYRKAIALLIREASEAITLLWLIRQLRITKVHYFCIYEKDSNWMALMLMKRGVFVNKIPSEVPLYFWNRVIIADRLSLCFGYQKEEVQVMKDQLFVKDLDLWVPEQAFEKEARYCFTDFPQARRTIGFYSSAHWLRRKKQDLDTGTFLEQKERDLLDALVDYLKAKPDVSLQIYLHPMEKKGAVSSEADRRYRYWLDQAPNVQLMDKEIPSDQSFYKTDVAVALFSTLLFERLFFGFKTLICPFGYDDFPVKNSNLRKICAYGKDELSGLLDKALSADPQEFFAQNGLDTYTYKAYPNIFHVRNSGISS